MACLLANATVVTMNPAREILERSDVLIEGNRIAKIRSGPHAAGRAPLPPRTEVIDCSGRVVIPGLVSAHTHLTGMLQRGLWDETSFEAWSHRSGETDKAFDLTPEDIYLIHSAACAELIRHGVTTVHNMFVIPAGRPQACASAALRALEDSGIRGILALLLRDQSPDNPAVVPDAQGEDWIGMARTLARECDRPQSRISLMLAPSAPQRCSDALLVRCRQVADELQLGTHTHLAETRRHAEVGRRLYGEPIVRHLERIGFLGPNLTVAHAVWLEDEEFELLVRHGVRVVHNPSANMKLGSGVARVKKMLRDGLAVGLGADSVNAGTVYSIFEQMKLSVLLPRTSLASRDWILPAEAFEMGTLGGAKAVLQEEAIGSIETGKKADLVVLTPALSMLPLNNLMASLALCENGSSVESVFVDGVAVMREGKLTAIDEEKVMAGLAAMRPRILKASATAAAK